MPPNARHMARSRPLARKARAWTRQTSVVARYKIDEDTHTVIVPDISHRLDTYGT